MSAGKRCVSLHNDVCSRIEGFNEGRHTYFTESPLIRLSPVLDTCTSS